MFLVAHAATCDLVCCITYICTYFSTFYTFRDVCRLCMERPSRRLGHKGYRRVPDGQRNGGVSRRKEW